MNYNDLTRNYFESAANAGELEGPGVFRGAAGNRDQGTWVQFDLRMLKVFKIGQHGKLDFVAESFNVLNHTNVVSLNQVYGPDRSPISVFATRNKASAPRQLQFSIDLEF